MELRFQKLIGDMVNDEELPQYVYRMRTINRYLFDSLINGEMWFSNPGDFNDPFDCDLNIKLTASSNERIQNYYNSYLKHSRYNKFKGTELITRGQFEELLNEEAKRVTQRKGIACFMSNCDNLLMWAHYADSHKGISLKFDILEDQDFFTPSRRVDYTIEYPEYDYLEDQDAFVNQMFFTKSSEWSYEGEVRVLKDFRGNVKFNPNALKEVIFGCNVSEGDKKTLIKILKNYYPNTQLTQAKKHNYEFGLDFETIENNTDKSIKTANSTNNLLNFDTESE